METDDHTGRVLSVALDPSPEAPVPAYLHVVDVGPRDDATPIVFLHGFSFDHRLWQAEVAALAATRRCVSYDLRGFGRSSLPDPQHPFAHWSDLGVLLDALGIAQADLVGLSLGGAAAIDLALMRPERVRRIVVLGSVLGGWEYKTDEVSPKACWELGPTEGVAAAKRAWQAGPMFVTSPRTAAGRALVHKMVADFSGWQFVYDAPLVRLDPPAAARLEALAAPILALVGEDDVGDIHDIAAAIGQRAPRGERRVVPGAGHILNLDAPEVVLAALREHLG